MPYGILNLVNGSPYLKKNDYPIHHSHFLLLRCSDVVLPVIKKIEIIVQVFSFFTIKKKRSYLSARNILKYKVEKLRIHQIEDISLVLCLNSIAALRSSEIEIQLVPLVTVSLKF